MTDGLNTYSWLLTAISLVAFGLEALAIFSVVHAIKHVRSSQATVAWTVALLTLPLITLPLYWIFSRNRFEGYREAIRSVGIQHQRSVRAIRDEIRTDSYARSTTLQTPLEVLADTLDTPIGETTETRLLIDGPNFFETAFREMGDAKKYIYASFYILRDDELGQKFGETLIDMANQGIKIRVVYDEVGSLRITATFLDSLRTAGIDIRPFDTRQGLTNRFQINFRNHRKLIVIDGHTALVGGLNVGSEYLGTPTNVMDWRDTGVLLRGTATRKVQAVFAGDYYWAARKDLPEAIWSPQPKPENHETDEGKTALDDPIAESYTPTSKTITSQAVVCATGPADQRPRASMMFATLAGLARQRLWICTPYLVPDESTTVALHCAQARGVDIRILITDRADHWAVYLAGIHYANTLSDANIRVHRYSKGFMHQKCVLVDDDLALIGSTNLDQRSLHLNFELMLASGDEKLIREMDCMIQKDLANSTEQHPSDWWLLRIGTAVARLFSPIL